MGEEERSVLLIHGVRPVEDEGSEIRTRFLLLCGVAGGVFIPFLLTVDLLADGELWSGRGPVVVRLLLLAAIDLLLLTASIES